MVFGKETKPSMVLNRPSKSTPEPFPYEPASWIYERASKLQADRDERLIRQLCFNHRVDPLNVACADLVWENHCLKVAINHFELICTAWKEKQHG